MSTNSLFPEEIIPMITSEPAPEKKRGTYHDRNGKFTSKRTAEMAELQKENTRLEKCFNYYKRVNKRLSDEIKEVEEKVKELEAKLKAYENVQSKEVSIDIKELGLKLNEMGTKMNAYENAQ